MGRLIDTSELHNVVMRRSKEYGRLETEVDHIVEEMVKETPTVRAIKTDRVRQAREEIKNINPVYTILGNGIKVLKNCDDVKAEVLAIMDKLIAENGG